MVRIFCLIGQSMKEKAFGQLLRILRNERGKTLQAVAMATGISVSRLSRIESGGAEAKKEEAAALAMHYASIDLLQAFWVDTPLHDAAVQICARLGLEPQAKEEITVRQFGLEIIDSAQRMMRYCNPLPSHDASRHESILLISQEASRIGNCAVALRMLVCGVKG